MTLTLDNKALIGLTKDRFGFNFEVIDAQDRAFTLQKITKDLRIMLNRIPQIQKTTTKAQIFYNVTNYIATSTPVG